MTITPKIPDVLLDDSFNLPTPAIIYDLNTIRYVMNCILEDIHIIPKCRLFFAVKANRNFHILRFFADHDIGADVASIQEYELAKKAGITTFSATSPSFTKADFEALHLDGVIPDYNSLSQLRYALSTLRMHREIGLRIRVPLQLGSDYNTTFGNNSRFGCDISSEELRGFINNHRLSVKRLHVHVGEMRDSSVMAQVMNHVREAVHIFDEVECINLGGGLTYLYSNSFEAKKTWSIVRDYIQDINRFLNRQVEVIVEPGMLLTCMAGYLLSTVLSSDKDKDTQHVVVDASAWNLMFWSSPMLIKAYTPNTDACVHHIYGSTCYEEDCFVRNNINDRLETGDRVLFSPAGAYVSSMARNMHGMRLPAEWIVNEQFNLIEAGENAW